MSGTNRAGEDLDLSLDEGSSLARVARRHPRAGWAEVAKRIAEKMSLSGPSSATPTNSNWCTPVFAKISSGNIEQMVNFA